VTKTATLSGVSRATVSNVMSAHMNHGKTSGKRNSGQKIKIDKKRLSYIEKDCLKKSQNYCSTGYSRTEYSS
jgi:DNA-binding LacI/PurR family transcriptional regulator